MGEGFRGEWNQESLRFLCRNRRVFQGNNLFSKGACYSAGEKLEPAGERKLIFLGNEKLRANVGMRVLRRGVESYFALLDAGVNWFEAHRQCEFILESGDSFSLLVTPLTGRDKKEIEMVLEGLAVRPDKTTRLRMVMKLVSAKEIQVEIEDLGFGDIFQGTGAKWSEKFTVE